MANSVDPDETASLEPSYVDLHCAQVLIMVGWAERVIRSLFGINNTCNTINSIQNTRVGTRDQ